MQSLNQCTSLCWPNVVLGMEASILWSRIKKNKILVRQWRPRRSVPHHNYNNRHKSHFRTVQKWFCFALSFIPLTTICFYTFFSPKENIRVFWLQPSPGSSRIMVHWIPSPLFSAQGSLSINYVQSQNLLRRRKNEKFPKTVSEKNIKKLHSSTSRFENLFWVSLWCLKTKWMPSLRLSSPFLESFVFKVNSSSFFSCKNILDFLFVIFFKKYFFFLSFSYFACKSILW